MKKHFKLLKVYEETHLAAKREASKYGMKLQDYVALKLSEDVKNEKRRFDRVF